LLNGSKDIGEYRGEKMLLRPAFVRKFSKKAFLRIRPAVAIVYNKFHPLKRSFSQQIGFQKLTIKCLHLRKPGESMSLYLPSASRRWQNKMATVENCSLADRMDRVYEKD